MNEIKFLIFLTAVILTRTFPALSQPSGEDVDYYENWIGKWYQEIDGETASEPRFIVKQALYKGSYEETWLMEGYKAKAWRAWDSKSRNWDFAWMSDNGLFQIWEGRKVKDIWYIYKTFIIEQKEVLSRQAFIFPNDTTMIRTSEHSMDNGKSWKLRFKEKYVKKSNGQDKYGEGN